MSIYTDSSNDAIWVVLQQEVDRVLKPIVFFSKCQEPPQRKHSAFDMELVAMHDAVKPFRHFLEGRTYHSRTDHEPLTTTMNQLRASWSPRVTRHLVFISEFTTDVRHVRREDNSMADAISRAPPVQPLHALIQHIPSLDYPALANAQSTDSHLQGLL
ncbi:hypothetical protein Pcinc_005888 [Petrolisthes cinctipes]|uniref:Reverse transcriptase RNase H-like domain-containing protein n=1 Tax=Petrolisthes cinctipes TaxID=88211 RepID=A0AAE1GDY8_PETCI|nr:hypothetical protein Pcinc_005888 [Petrolisthes cinctipes]